MTAKQLFQAGKLDEAIKAAGAEVKDNPTDTQRRIFLFELLCFTGDYDRAEKHLNLLAESSKEAELGAVLYYAALHAERLRQDLFAKKEFPAPVEEQDFSGSLNGKPFEWIADSDPRIAERLELYAAGAYLWIGFEHIVSIEMEAPKRLRDLLWIPALVRTGPSFKDKELGEVMIPVLYPNSSKHSSDDVRLGRATHWLDQEDGDPLPVGQKTFLVDGEEFALLDVRKIEFTQSQAERA
jgi:type VI secretion system protein ImpE